MSDSRVIVTLSAWHSVTETTAPMRATVDELYCEASASMIAADTSSVIEASPREIAAVISATTMRGASGGGLGIGLSIGSGGDGEGDGGGGSDGGGGGSAAARERVEAFLKGRLSVWELQAPLVELGLDSLDLVNLRTAFQKGFKCVVPLSTFTNANQTLDQLTAKLCERLLA